MPLGGMGRTIASALPTATCGYVGDPKGGGRAMRCWDLVYSVLTPRAANEETERGGRAPRTKRQQRYYNFLTFATIQQKKPAAALCNNRFF